MNTDQTTKKKHIQECIINGRLDELPSMSEFDWMSLYDDGFGVLGALGLMVDVWDTPQEIQEKIDKAQHDIPILLSKGYNPLQDYDTDDLYMLPSIKRVRDQNRSEEDLQSTQRYVRFWVKFCDQHGLKDLMGNNLLQIMAKTMFVQKIDFEGGQPHLFTEQNSEGNTVLHLMLSANMEVYQDGDEIDHLAQTAKFVTSMGGKWDTPNHAGETPFDLLERAMSVNGVFLNSEVDKLFRTIQRAMISEEVSEAGQAKMGHVKKM